MATFVNICRRSCVLATHIVVYILTYYHYGTKTSFIGSIGEQIKRTGVEELLETILVNETVTHILTRTSSPMSRAISVFARFSGQYRAPLRRGPH